MFPDADRYTFFIYRTRFFTKTTKRAEHAQKVQIFSLLNWTGRSLDNTVHTYVGIIKSLNTSIKNAGYD